MGPSHFLLPTFHFPLQCLKAQWGHVTFYFSLKMFYFLAGKPSPTSHFRRPSSHFSHPTSHFRFPTSDFPLSFLHFSLPTFHVRFPNSYFPLPTSHFPFPTYNLLPTSDFRFPTLHFSIPTSQFPLPTSHFLLPTSHFLLLSFSFQVCVWLRFVSMAAAAAVVVWIFPNITFKSKYIRCPDSRLEGKYIRRPMMVMLVLSELHTNKISWSDSNSMLGQRRRRRHNVNPALNEWLRWIIYKYIWFTLTLPPPNYSIWIFIHLMLCLADAIHNFKWVKIIPIWQNGGQPFSNISDWCHILSWPCSNGGT